MLPRGESDERKRVTARTILLSVNASWNVLNFRMPVVRALQERGDRVVVVAPEDGYGERLRAEGVEFEPIVMDRQGVSPWNDLRLLARYRSILGRTRPSLFLGYTAKPNIYGTLAARSLGIPAINNVSGLGTAFIRNGLLTAVVTGLYRLAFKGSHTVFFQNSDDRSLFLEKRIVAQHQARLLPGSGIDLDRFRPEAAAASDAFTFLLIGRLLWDKGVGEYVEAARQVRTGHPSAAFRILGFVDVPNRTAVPRAELDRWVEEGTIHYLQACDDVRPHIARADCIVLPSYREGLPRTLLEGAAMGKPLIATDVPGCRDIVKDGVNGLLCEVRDAASLASAMTTMIELQPAERQRMGAAGRRLAESEFDQALVVRRYLEAIDAAL